MFGNGGAGLGLGDGGADSGPGDGGSLPKPGDGGFLPGLGDGEAGRGSETAELTRIRRQRGWKALGDGGGAGTGLETAELARGRRSELVRVRRQRSWKGLRDGGADQTKYDETRCGDGGAGQGSERAELAKARREQSWPRLGDGGTDAGRTIGSQITPKTFLRCVNYGDSFAFDFEKTAWYFDSHFTRFSACFFYCPIGNLWFYFILSNYLSQLSNI